MLEIVLLDTLQAIVFKNSPFISWKENLEDNDSWVDKGIIIDTYYCTKEMDIVDVSRHLKTSKFTCPIDNIYELNLINDKISEYFLTNDNTYSNLSAHYVDVESEVVIVELADNNKEHQDWFRKNVIDSKYIKFVQGGPYYLYDNN